eukprot:9196759-Pyramimonas_sp.AAC.1
MSRPYRAEEPLRAEAQRHPCVISKWRAIVPRPCWGPSDLGSDSDKMIPMGGPTRARHGGRGERDTQARTSIAVWPRAQSRPRLEAAGNPE